MTPLMPAMPTGTVTFASPWACPPMPIGAPARPATHGFRPKLCSFSSNSRKAFSPMTPFCAAVSAR
eukprot:7539445-Lingulodinium_polyedra.AAC.1